MRLLIKKSETAFLHSGLILFAVPSALILLQSLDLLLFIGPKVRLFCSVSLLASIVCFVITYYAEVLSEQKTPLGNR
jgi:putative effector of murein hydrolase LrgA (UPF0299 family)